MLPSFARLIFVSYIFQVRKMQVGNILQVKTLVPIWVQRSFSHCRGLGLFAVDGGHSKWVGKSYRGQGNLKLYNRARHGTYGKHLACRGRLPR